MCNLDLTLPYLTLPYLTLPYLTLPYLTLPYLTLPYLEVFVTLLSLLLLPNVVRVIPFQHPPPPPPPTAFSEGQIEEKFIFCCGERKNSVNFD